MNEILDQTLVHFGNYNLTVGNVLSAMAVLLVARIISFALGTIIHRYAGQHKIDSGREYAVRTLMKYLLYTMALLLATQAMGINLNVIWAGAAALLVGLGFGLQHFFNDLVSGLILLVEGTVEVNDVVIVNGIMGVVVKIGLRTSHVQTRDREVIIIPNSKLVSENVVNWSHNNTSTRFALKVGVAYSSNPELVKQLLEQVAVEHPLIDKDPAPRVAFSDYGDSALMFTLYFFSSEFLGNEFIKSDLRFALNQLFLKHHIQIPFPQRELWINHPEQGPIESPI